MGVDVAGLVAAGRELASGAFLDSATVRDRTLVPDGHGGSAEVFTARPAPVMMSLVQVKDGEVVDDAGVLQGQAMVTAMCAYGTDLPDGTRVDVLGVSYEVVARRSAESARTVLERYVLREVR